MFFIPVIITQKIVLISKIHTSQAPTIKLFIYAEATLPYNLSTLNQLHNFSRVKVFS